VLDEARVWRPVRFTDADGRRAWRLEGRSVQRGREWLLFAVIGGGNRHAILASIGSAPWFTDLRRDVPLVPGKPVTLAPE
jgi:hypothetical protein